MKNISKKTFIWSIRFLAAGIVLVFLAVFFWQEIGAFNLSANLGSITWQRYENKEYEFEIQFPVKWHFREMRHDLNVYRPDTKKVEQFPSFSFQSKEKVNLVTPGGPHGSVFEIELHPASNFSPPPRGVKKEIVGGMDAQCYRSTKDIIFDCWIWINRDDYFFRLTGYATNQAEKNRNGPVLEKMLSSFRHTKPGFIQEASPISIK